MMIVLLLVGWLAVVAGSYQLAKIVLSRSGQL